MSWIELLGSSLYALAIPGLTTPLFWPNLCISVRPYFRRITRLFTLVSSNFDHIVDIRCIQRVTHLPYIGTKGNPPALYWSSTPILAIPELTTPLFWPNLCISVRLNF